MAEAVNRKVKLPDGKNITVRVPSDWGAEEIRNELQKRGVIGESAKDSGLLSTIGQNIAEVPSAVARGAERGTEEVLQFYGDMRESLGEQFPFLKKMDLFSIMGYDKKLKEATGKNITETLQSVDIPDVADDPETALGQFTEAATQFGVGFAASPIKGGGYARNVLMRGALADMSSFDPDAGNLSNLIQEYPVLENPITEALATDTDDNRWVNRLRNAVEGAGIQVAVDGIVRSVRSLKNKGKTKTLREKAEEVAQEPQPVGENVGQVAEAPVEEIPQRAMSAESRQFRAQIMDMYERSPNFDDFVEEGARRFGEEFRDVANPLWTSAKTEAEGAGEVAARQGAADYGQKLNTTEDIESYVKNLEEKFGKAEKETVSWSEIRERASSLGMTPDQIERLRSESKNWSVRFRAAEDAMLESLEATQRYASKAVDGSSEDLRAFYEQMARDAELLNTVAGIRSEAGRTLNSMKQISEATGRRQQLWEEFIDRNGGEGSLKELARLVRDAEDPSSMRRVQQRALREPTLLDATVEIWKNWGLLSGPQTHVVNFVSNAATQAWTIPEEYATWMIGKGRRAVGKALGTRGKEALKFNEANSFAHGFIQASKDAVISAGKTFGSDDQILRIGRREIRDELGKLELQAHRAWSSNTFAKHIPESILNKVPESTRRRLGKGFDFASEYGVRLPGKALYMGDAFWKTFGYRTKLTQLLQQEANRRVANGLMKKDEVADFIRKGIDDPPATIHNKAMENARYTTYTKELGKSGKQIQSIVGQYPGLHFIVPFIRTPINIIKYAGERTPFGVASRKVRDELKAGGIRRDRQMAKMTLGSAMMAGIMEEAVKENITGGAPQDPEQRANFYATGRQPYSIKIGDQWHSYSRLEPFSTIFGLAANLNKVEEYMTEEEYQKASAGLMLAASDVVIEKTFMRGVADLFKAIRDPENYAQRPLQNLVGTAAMPNLAAQWARSADPYLKDVQTLMDSVEQRTPGLREQVVNRVNIWGEDVDLNSSLWNPFWTSNINDSPLLSDMYHNEIQISKPERQIGGVKLSPKLYREYVKWGRTRAREELEAYYNLPEFKNLSVEKREEYIKKVVRKWDERARKVMMPKILDEYRQYRRQEIEAQATPEREKIDITAE